MIVRMAWQFGVSSVRELVDTALEESVVEKIKKTIVSVPGVCALHHLRTRSVGGVFFLDVHILVDPTISVSEGHFIGQEVHFRLMREIPGVEDVTVHVDPEDDEVIAPSRNLPTRVDLINLMKQRWSALLPADAIETVILHYLGGKIHIELRLTFDLALDELKLQEIINQLQQKITDIPSIAKIDILFQLPKKPVTL
jgi:divalent metal cation (Fe/Co/Zn/Cd) transporter